MSQVPALNSPRLYVSLAVVLLTFLLTISFYKNQSTSTASANTQTLSSQNRILPTLDYEEEISKPKSKDRKQKSAHFNVGPHPNGWPIKELPGDDQPLPAPAHFWGGLAPLPVDQSDAIVLGIIGKSEARLSDDLTAVYSEYSLMVSEIFKDTTYSIIPGPLPVNRLGGAVRFKSGKIQRYEFSLQGIPQAGAEYVLFLRKSEHGDLLILTAYEISNDRVTPLDGDPGKDPRLKLPFSKYQDAQPSTFFHDLRTAVEKTGGGN